ncbi:hypothetical protein OAP36_02090 [Planktomarina temperata]|nr:hypothetical protein [Planktomarina temperata]
MYMPVFLLANFSDIEAAQWFVAIAAFTAITAFDFGILQYLQFRLFRLYKKVGPSRERTKLHMSYNTFFWLTFLFILITNLFINDFFFEQYYWLSIAVSVGFINRYLQITLRGCGHFTIGLLINALPIVSFIICLRFYFGDNADFSHLQYIFCMAQLLATVCHITYITIWSQASIRVIFRWKKGHDFFTRSVSFWWLSILQNLNQFLPPVVLNSVYSATDILPYLTLRTLTSLPLSVSSVINTAIQPFVTDTLTTNRLSKKAVLKKVNLLFTLLGMILSLLLIVFGKLFYEVWLSGELKFEIILFYVLVLRMILQLFIHVQQNLSLGLGNPLKTLAYDIFIVTGLLAGKVMSLYWSMGIESFVLLFLVLPSLTAILYVQVLRK